MYSLGIILFELYFPFRTDMERIMNINNLKSKFLLPEEFTKNWKKQVTIFNC